jgi:gliding motility-associated-like protein
VLPNPTVSAEGATVCAGQPAVITATGGVTYQWSGPGFLSSVKNAVIPNVNNNTIGNYVVTATALNSCTDAATVKVDLIAIPIASAVATPTVCFNSLVQLQGFGGETYFWKGPFDFVSSKQTTTFVAASMGLSGIYTLNAISKSGCIGTATAAVSILAIPEGTLNSSTDQHCVPFCSDFKFVNKNATPLVNTTWRFNGQQFNSAIFSRCFTLPGNYIIFGSFTDQNACANTTSFVIVADESPNADFIYTPIRPFETKDEVVFENNSKGNDINKFFWAFENNTGLKSDKENVSYYFNEAGVYPVTFVVKNRLGCADTVIKAITVEEDFSLFVPEAFTPNQDGKNETFQPKGRGVVSYHFLVHNRWGERLFETNDFSQGWDGSYKGKPCKEELYQWTVKAVNKSGKVKELSGQVALYR